MSMEGGTTNINDVFFEGSYKDLWRKINPPALSEAECDFIEEMTGLQRGENVLDVMCGFGRHALPLARRGYRVHAVDNAKDYIEEIKTIASQESLPLVAETVGALEATFPDQYKAAIIMGNSFAFFNKSDTVLLLKKIAAHLSTNGVLVINSYMIAEIAMRHYQQRQWSQVEDFKYLLEYTFCFRPNRIESEHTVIMPNGAVEVIKGIDYIFSLNELEQMFTEAGFRLLDVYATPRKRKFKMGDYVSYLVVEKMG